MGGARCKMSGSKSGEENPAGRSTVDAGSRQDSVGKSGPTKGSPAGRQIELNADTRARIKAHITAMLKRAHP